MYLKIGTIVKQVGLKGEVRVFSTTSFAKKRYEKSNKVFIKLNNNYKELTVNTYRKLDKQFDVVSFDEYPDSKSTEELLKLDLFAIKDESVLNENDYFYVDLIGCTIISNSDNSNCGKVVDIEEFPAQLTLKCDFNGKIFYVPFVEQFIKKIDIKNKTIVVNVIEGLIWNL